jgi:hypothetical protein
VLDGLLTSVKRSTPTATFGDDPQLTEGFRCGEGHAGARLEWGEGDRGLGREAIASILQGQMGQAIDEHLDRMAVLDQADRRNGSFRRHL